MSVRVAQRMLPFRYWGGARRGAGRKRVGALSRVPHGVRAQHRSERPVHVTMRVRYGVLRTQSVFPVVRGVLRAVNQRAPDRFRIVEFSVQTNHLHLLVEADSQASLTSGMRSLAIRLALRVNPVLKRRGPLLADRWHGRELGTPREVRNALVYVLANGVKHGVNGTRALDALSSAPYFRGFKEAREISELERTDAANVAARTWLLRSGWQKWGLISIAERPKS